MKGIIGLVVLMVGLQVLLNSAQACSTFCQDCCDLQFKSLGCYEKDPIVGSLSTDNRLIESTQPDENWEGYMYNFICQCAQAVGKKYKYFGISMKGTNNKDIDECWGINNWGPPDIPQNHVVNKCVNCKKTSCIYKKDKYCAGKRKGIFMYEPVDMSCKFTMRYVGCFKDKQKPNRALGEYVLTGRQNLKQLVEPPLGRIKNYGWFNYDTWLPRFACKCARAAFCEHKRFFGLQFWGECWIGDDKGDDYKKYGKDKAVCNDNCFKECKTPYCGRWCVGEKWSNAVYEIVTPFNQIKYNKVCPYPEYKKP